MKRGLIFYPFDIAPIPDNMWTEGGSDHVIRLMGDRIAEENMQFAVLYWDKVLLLPVSPSHPTPLGAIASFLQAFDAAEVITLQFPLSLSEESIAGLTAEYRAREDEIWSTYVHAPHQLLSSRSIPTRTEPTRSTFEIALKAKLPVPDNDVPLSDVLDFKERRRNEHQALHFYLDDLAATYRANPDEVQPVTRAVERLTTALSDAEKAYSERWRVRLRRGIRTGFVHNIVIPTAVHLRTGLEIDKAFLAGGVSGAITTFTETFRTTAPEKSFAYAIDARKAFQRQTRRRLFRP